MFLLSLGFDEEFQSQSPRWRINSVSWCLEQSISKADGNGRSAHETPLCKKELAMADSELNRRRQEQAMRALYPEVAPQEIEWQGGSIIGEQPAQGIFNFQCSLGIFRLRGGNPESHWGTHPDQLTVRGRILAERADQNEIKGLLQILEVTEIISRPLTAEEESQRKETIESYIKGPFLGRLNRPDVFGPDPDLDSPITSEQWQKLLGQEDEGGGQYRCD